MANFNRGKYHSLGYVNGALYYGITSSLAGTVGLLMVAGIQPRLRWILFFGSLSALSFAIFNFALFVEYRTFGNGTKSKIKNSMNLKYSSNTFLYNRISDILICSILSLMICIIITGFLFLAFLIQSGV